MRIAERIDSSHMPLELTIQKSELQTDDEVECRQLPHESSCCKIKVEDELAQQYQQHLLSADTQAKLKDAISMIDIEINEALAMFTEVLWENAKCMENISVVTTMRN